MLCWKFFSGMCKIRYCSPHPQPLSNWRGEWAFNRLFGILMVLQCISMYFNLFLNFWFIVYCLLFTVFFYFVLYTLYFIPLFYVHCLLPTAYCLLPTAYCLLPTAYCSMLNYFIARAKSIISDRIALYLFVL